MCSQLRLTTRHQTGRTVRLSGLARQSVLDASYQCEAHHAAHTVQTLTDCMQAALLLGKRSERGTSAQPPRLAREPHMPAAAQRAEHARLVTGCLCCGALNMHAILGVYGFRVVLRCMQAALLAAGPSMRPSNGPSSRMSGLPRHSVPSMRKEVVLATKAELADRKQSREEPLSTFDLEKLKAFSRGWTPDRGRGGDLLCYPINSTPPAGRSCDAVKLSTSSKEPLSDLEKAKAATHLAGCPDAGRVPVLSACQPQRCTRGSDHRVFCILNTEHHPEAVLH